MSWSVETTEKFDKEFARLDRYVQKLIKSWITKRLVDSEDPRVYGKAMIADKRGLWRYRIGDYRLICSLQDDKLIILMLTVGHRKEIYNK